MIRTIILHDPTVIIHKSNQSKTQPCAYFMIYRMNSMPYQYYSDGLWAVTRPKDTCRWDEINGLPSGIQCKITAAGQVQFIDTWHENGKPAKRIFGWITSTYKNSLLMCGIKMENPTKIILGWITSIYEWVFSLFNIWITMSSKKAQSTWLRSRKFD